MRSAKLTEIITVSQKPNWVSFHGRPPTFIPMNPETSAAVAITSPAESRNFIKLFKLEFIISVNKPLIESRRSRNIWIVFVSRRCWISNLKQSSFWRTALNCGSLINAATVSDWSFMVCSKKTNFLVKLVNALNSSLLNDSWAAASSWSIFGLYYKRAFIKFCWHLRV